jgi:transketolase
LSKKVATREAYGEALVELGRVDNRIVVLDADLSTSTRTILFAKEFPDRFFNFGIAEANMMCVGAGLASCGKMVFASTFAVFASGRAYNQFRTSIAYPQLNVKVVATHGGISVGEDGVTHQCVEDVAMMRALPHTTVILPADGIETKEAVRASIEWPGPVYMRLSRPATPLVYEEGYEFNGRALRFRIGEAVKLSEGKDVTIIATGAMVSEALTAATGLAKEGLSTTVLNVHTIKPLDESMIVKTAKETGGVVTAEEHSILGGLGGAVAEVLTENVQVPMIRVGIRDAFGESGTPSELLTKYGLTASDIIAASKRVLKMKR